MFNTGDAKKDEKEDMTSVNKFTPATDPPQKTGDAKKNAKEDMTSVEKFNWHTLEFENTSLNNMLGCYWANKRGFHKKGCFQ